MTGFLAEESALTQYHSHSKRGALIAVEKASEVKKHYVGSEIEQRVRQVLTDAENYGVSHIRAFADVDNKAGLRGIKSLLRIREEFKDRIAIELVAFPQEGIIKEPGAEELLYKSMELGADVVGGIPWIERTRLDSKKHIKIGFEIAKQFDVEVAMLTDDSADAGLRTTEYLAAETIRNGWTGRVAACHARSTALYSAADHRKLVALLKKAGMSVITNPHTGPLHVRVKDLANAGVTVALGQDDVYDAYYPYGRCNMLEVAFLAGHLMWMMTREDREMLYDMITMNPAKIMKLHDYGITPGGTANLVILNAEDTREAFASHSEPAVVIRNGAVQCETKTNRTVHEMGT
jgi:cytosine deaminase